MRCCLAIDLFVGQITRTTSHTISRMLVGTIWLIEYGCLLQGDMHQHPKWTTSENGHCVVLRIEQDLHDVTR